MNQRTASCSFHALMYMTEGMALRRHRRRCERECQPVFVDRDGQANGIEPYHYLVALFKNLPLAETADDFEALLPWRLTQ